MKRVLFFLMTAIFLSTSMASAKTDDKIGKLVKSLRAEITSHALLSETFKVLAIQKMLPMVTNSVFVQETIKQNKRGVSLSEIKKIDEQWKNAEEELPVQSEKLSNAAAKVIKEWVQRNANFVEIFVMDDQGAVVGENALTGDYWQGDEAKWKNSYKNKSGGLDVGKVKFDKSANQKLQQVSLPIIASGGAVVGAITFGFKVN